MLILNVWITMLIAGLVTFNQSTITKAWDVVSNYAMWFMAVPADGSNGFNKNNLVALGDDGKLPSGVLPASAVSSSTNKDNLVIVGRTYYHSCPSGYYTYQIKTHDWWRIAMHWYHTLIPTEGCEWQNWAPNGSEIMYKFLNYSTSQWCDYITYCVAK